MVVPFLPRGFLFCEMLSLSDIKSSLEISAALSSEVSGFFLRPPLLALVLGGPITCCSMSGRDWEATGVGGLGVLLVRLVSWAFVLEECSTEAVLRPLGWLGGVRPSELLLVLDLVRKCGCELCCTVCSASTKSPAVFFGSRPRRRDFIWFLPLSWEAWVSGSIWSVGGEALADLLLLRLGGPCCCLSLGRCSCAWGTAKGEFSWVWDRALSLGDCHLDRWWGLAFLISLVSPSSWSDTLGHVSVWDTNRYSNIQMFLIIIIIMIII